jgi:DNA-binding beta-propeller fold protein YncE
MRWVSVATAASLAACLLAALSPHTPSAFAGTFAFGSDNRAVALDAGTGVAYVASHGDGKVYTMTSAGQTGSFAVTNPHLVEVDTTAHRTYVTSDESNTIVYAEGGNVIGAVPTIAQSQIPSDIAVNTSTRLVYVTSKLTGSVIVFNPVSNQTTSFSLAGITSFSAVAVDAAKGLIFLSGASRISILNVSDHSLVDTVVLAANAQSIAVNPVTHTAYATLEGDNKGIAVIDGRTATATIAGTYNSRFDGLAIDTSTNTLYAGSGAPGSSVRTLSTINATTNQLISSVTMPGLVEGLAVDPGFNTLFIVPAATDTVIVKTAAALTDLALPAATIGLAYSYGLIFKGDPLTGWVLSGALPPGLTLDTVNNRISGTPSTIGSYTFTLTTSNGVVGVGTTPSLTLVVRGVPKLALPGTPTVTAIAVDDSKHVVYVADSAARQVHVLNGETGALITSIAVGTAPNAIAIDPDAHVVYVGSSSGSTNWLAIIRGPDSTVLRPTTGYKKDASDIAIYARIYDLAFDTSSKKLYGACNNIGALIIDTLNNYSAQTIAPGTVRFVGVAVDSATHVVYFSDASSSRVAAMSTAADGTLTFTYSGSTKFITNDIAVDPENFKVYTADLNSATGLSRINYENFSGAGNGAVTYSNAVVYGYGIARDSSADILYVTDGVNKAVSAITSGAGTNVLVGRSTIADYPTYIAVDSTNHRVYTMTSNYVATYMPPTITSAAPTGARTNQPFSHQIVAAGLPASSFTTSTLPPGLTLTSAGRLAGTPTSDGTYSFTITAKNGIIGDSADATKTYSMTIGSVPSLTAFEAPGTGAVNVPYAGYTFSATGTAPVTFAVNSGALPAGMTLSSGGVLSGTPTAYGTFTYSVMASNAFSPTSISNARKLVVDEAGSLKVSVVDQQLSTPFSAGGTQTVTGTLRLLVESTRPRGWTVSLRSGNLTYRSYVVGKIAPDIPAQNFTLTSVDAILLTDSGQAVNAGTNIAVTGPQSANVGGIVAGSLETPIIISRTAAGYGVGKYAITVGISISLPAGVDVGLYTTTMIPTIVSRP